MFPGRISTFKSCVYATLFCFVFSRAFLAEQQEGDFPRAVHMVAHPSQAFEKPSSAAFVYFVGLLERSHHTYMQWALASLQSLIDTKTQWDIIVFLDGYESEQVVHAFQALGVTRVHRFQEYVKNMTNDVDMAPFWKVSEGSMNVYPFTWNKLLAWTLVEYQKVAVIDPDVLAWNNADDIMYYPQLSAVPDQFWPLISETSEYPEYFNAGVFVIEPSLHTFSSVVNGLTTYSRPKTFWWDPSEQTYLNMFFNSTWYQLPMYYNYASALLDFVTKINWGRSTLKLVHYIKGSSHAIPLSEDSCTGFGAVCEYCCKRNVYFKNKALLMLEEKGIDIVSSLKLPQESLKNPTNS